MPDELRKAAVDGDLQELSRLLDAEANIDRESLGSALYAAIENQNIDCVQLLIRRGADIEHPGRAKDRTTMTPLAHAVDSAIDGTIQTGGSQGDEPTEMINFLLAAGADPQPGLNVARDYQSVKIMVLLTTGKSLNSALDVSLHSAAEAIRSADALLIGAGAGMGVDSGLPDFRGPEGFWKAYPAFRGKEFAELSTPHWFQTDPALAWGFFGHRLNMYRAAVPHRGFAILRRWTEAKPGGAIVFTSNVDGQFQKAGFAEDSIAERHGSIHFLQCVARCGREIWPTEGVQIDVEESTVRAVSDLPRCPECNALARPNILMFDDWHWDQARTIEQLARYRRWLRAVQGKRVVAIELGAGLAIPTVRRECEVQGQVLIRINPRECETPPGGISVPLGAREALDRIDSLL